MDDKENLSEEERVHRAEAAKNIAELLHTLKKMEKEMVLVDSSVRDAKWALREFDDETLLGTWDKEIRYGYLTCFVQKTGVEIFLDKKRRNVAEYIGFCPKNWVVFGTKCNEKHQTFTTKYKHFVAILAQYLS